MKTKQQILKMSKEELEDYKWSDDLKMKENSHCSDCSGCSGCFDCFDCFDCSYCSDCSYCYDCYDCSKCYLCRNTQNLKHAICNVELGKEEYFNKLKELGV